MKTSFRPRLKFVENQVNGRISGLHYMWLVPRTRASSDNVDGFLTLRVDPLEEERSTLRTWPNQYLRGHRIMLCGGTRPYGVWLVLTTRCRILVPMASFWGSGLCPLSPTVALHVLLNLGVKAALMYLDSLRLPSCARNPYISSGRSGA
ncbi:hypothetical protein M9H77_36760 [Catharanthus roseus]|uniref:Uncharacterized protein n=1 Tax=Catharanthus roseus TaxID=4058 RepID=A0ACB9ZWG7_CATRO|nr:hypothetical protein M9H77_36760 [Catharanthus roseus]